MTPPAVNTFAQTIYEDLAADRPGDEDRGYALLLLVGALGQTFDQLNTFVADLASGALLDPTRTTSDRLTWLAQFAGVQLAPNTSEAQQRALIQAEAGFERGTPASLTAIAAAYLTGTAFTATTTSDSPTLTSVSSFTNLNRGEVTLLEASGIPAGATITSLDPGTGSLVMSKSATETATVTVVAKTVFLQERFGGDPYQARIAVYADETHSYALAKANSSTYATARLAFSTYAVAGAYGSTVINSALAQAKPAGIVLTFDSITGGDYDSARDTHATYQAASSTYATYAAAHANPTQQ